MKTVKTYTVLFIVAFSLLVTGLTSCLDDLNTIPLDPEELVSDVVFGDEWPSAVTVVVMAIPMLLVWMAAARHLSLEVCGIFNNYLPTKHSVHGMMWVSLT